MHLYAQFSYTFSEFKYLTHIMKPTLRNSWIWCLPKYLLGLKFEIVLYHATQESWVKFSFLNQIHSYNMKYAVIPDLTDFY